jgi:hypothetical protein
MKELFEIAFKNETIGREGYGGLGQSLLELTLGFSRRGPPRTITQKRGGRVYQNAAVINLERN